MSRSSNDCLGSAEAASLLAAVKPTPILLPTVQDMQLVPEEPWPEVPRKGYMQPTASYLAKQRSRKTRNSGNRGTKSVRTSSRASGDSSKIGRNTATPISIGGTFDSAWDMVSPASDNVPISHSIVEDWLNDCDSNGEEKREQQYGKEFDSMLANRAIVPVIQQEKGHPEVPLVEIQREGRKRRGVFGHICSFLLGAGVVTLFNAFTS